MAAPATVWILVVFCLKILDSAGSIVIRDEMQAPSPSFSTRRNDKFANLETYPNMDTNDLSSNVNNNQYRPSSQKEPRCSSRLETALEQIRRRQQVKQQSRQHSGLELEGYSLHQSLRSIPYDMYVTDMRVRLPATNNWVRVDKCQFNPRNKSLETRLLFNDLTISGNVNLYKDDEVKREPYRYPKETCGMILRLRKAGIGFYTEPVRREHGQFNIRTDSHFLEPGFISVYAYGCEPKLKEHRRDDEDSIEEKDEVSREMENIFLKGIRSLLTTYMQKELQPAIKQTLMTNLGYTISYGR